MLRINIVLFLLVVALFACSRERNENEPEKPQLPSENIDSLSYRIIKMGSQTWFAENLNEMPRFGNSWCYGNYDEESCKKYGRLYDWVGANNACPSGWRLPSKEDYDGLLEYAKKEYEGSEGTVLKDEKGWNAIFGGVKYEDMGFGLLDEQAFWWSSTEADISNARYRQIKKDSKEFNSGYDKKTKGYSVRCIKG